MDLLWIALFGLLCFGILGLLTACERWLALTPSASSMVNAPKARPGNDTEGSTQ